MALMHPDDFKTKRDTLARWNDPNSFRRTIGPQMLYLSRGLSAMKDPELRQVGRSLYTLYESSVNGGATEDGELARALEQLSRLPKLLKENGNAELAELNRVMDEQPEYKKDLPEELRDKSVLDHLRSVDVFMELGCEPYFKHFEENHEAELEQKRQLEEKKEQQRQLEEERQRNVLAERQAFRQKHGAFMYPDGCDAHDAAGMFVLSGLKNGGEYQALQNLCNALGDRLDEREQYVEDETLKRMQEFDSQYPSDADPETRQKLIREVMDSVSAQKKEEHLNNWYPDGLEKPIEEKQKELGTTDKGPTLLRELYGDAMAVQYKNAQREKKYGKSAIEDAMRAADRELAEEKIEKLSKGTEEERESLRQQRDQCRNDIIARRFKSKVMDAFRPKQNAILSRYCRRMEDKNRYKHLAKSINPTNDQLYEAVMNDFLDKVLVNKEEWDSYQEGFRKLFGTPKEWEGHEEPLTDVLKETMNDPELEKQVDLELPDRVAQQTPFDELDRRIDQKLGYQAPKTDELLYEWARDTQKLRIRNDILKQREQEFRDITQDNVAELTRLRNDLRDILNICKPTEQLPTAEMFAGRVKKTAAALEDARDTLCNMPTKDGKIGEAYDALDQAWTNADFAPGKDLRTRSGVKPDAPVESVNHGGKTAKQVSPVDSSTSIGISLERHWSTKPRTAKKYIFTDEQQVTRKKEEQLEEQEPVDEEVDLDVTVVENNPLELSEDIKPDLWLNFYAELEPKLREEFHNSDARNAKVKEIYNSYQKLEQFRDEQWRSLQEDRTMPEKAREQRLAGCLTATLQMRQLKNGESVPTDEQSLQAASSRLQDSLAFTLLKEDMFRGALNVKNPDAMVSPYQAKQRAEKAIMARQDTIRSRMKPIQTALENTRNGTVLFFPRAGLLGNSQSYIDALHAIQRAGDPNTNAKTLYEDKQVVLNYLNDKMKVRIRAFGKERWKQCMTYLKNVMPREEFQAYCNKVNEVRGVSGKPLNKNFVSPQDFGPTNYKEAQSELLADVRRASNAEDCAALIALRKMDPDTEVDRRVLSAATKDIMEDKTFQWLAKDHPEKLKSYVEGWNPEDPDYLDKFRKEAEKNAPKAEKTEPVQQQGPEPKKLEHTK